MDKIESAINLLKRDAHLRKLLLATPEAIVMPFAEERQKRYIAISMLITEEAVSRSTLGEICRRTVEILRENEVLVDVDGLEIMLGSTNAGRPKRVLRLGIPSNALKEFEGLNVTSLDPVSLPAGVVCQMYREVPT